MSTEQVKANKGRLYNGKRILFCTSLLIRVLDRIKSVGSSRNRNSKASFCFVESKILFKGLLYIFFLESKKVLLLRSVESSVLVYQYCQAKGL